MSSFLIQEAAGFRLDQIYRYTRDKWGEKQAEIYMFGLFKAFQDIAEQRILSWPIPAEFGECDWQLLHQSPAMQSSPGSLCQTD